MCAKRKAEILLHLDERSEKPLYQQVYEQIRDLITSGQLAEGDRLTSIRRLSADFGISHTTVEQAYLQLSVEGFVTNVPRSGYVVAHVDTDYFKLTRTADQQKIRDIEHERDKVAFFAENRSGSTVRYDFSYANLQPDSFPVKTWRLISDEILFARTAPELARYSYTDDACALQAELAQLLERAQRQNVKVYGASRMRLAADDPGSSVLVGFSSIAFDDIAPGVRALREAWLE